jgi:hypothetical protein
MSGVIDDRQALQDAPFGGAVENEIDAGPMCSPLFSQGFHHRRAGSLDSMRTMEPCRPLAHNCRRHILPLPTISNGGLRWQGMHCYR